MKRRVIAYRAATTYMAFNVFWEPPTGEWSPSASTPIGMLWSKDDVINYCNIHGAGSPIWR